MVPLESTGTKPIGDYNLQNWLYIVVIDQNTHASPNYLLFESPDLVIGGPPTPKFNRGTISGVTVVGQVNVQVRIFELNAAI